MNKIPKREEIKKEDKWNLEGLYSSEEDWEKDLNRLKQLSKGINKYKGTLGKSAQALRECLDYMNSIEMLAERLGSYAHLRVNEDEGNSSSQERFARYIAVASMISAESSWQSPEIQAIKSSVMEVYLKEEGLKDYRIMLKKILRYKPHVLTAQEEKLIAMQAEANQTASKAFSALTNVDMDFGSIILDEKELPLTQSTFSTFLINPDREIRKKAYFQFYNVFDSHKNTIANLYAGNVHLDIYKSKIRNYPSSRLAALFPDKVEEDVYDNLIDTITENLPLLHKYYNLRRRALGLERLAHYDAYAPFVKDIKVKHSYNEAVEVIINALKPLGQEYCNTLKNGLTSGWVDRYENKGKRSGAFSAGCYFGDPYILMNYKEDVLRDVFTLAHEGGHSMHSWYSVHNNPFQHYDYTIFEAEVASTFNEQLLAKYLFDNAKTNAMKAYLTGKQIDDIVATIFRQTMFAEFEHLSHKMVEEGNPLTVDSIRRLYRGLLEKYFGLEVEFFNVSDLEGLRIPHFYRAFYVYKYATGLSAAISLSSKVLNGNDSDRAQYLDFLKSGGSKYPIESLAIAGVDMSSPKPVVDAMKRFEELLAKLEGLLGL